MKYEVYTEIEVTGDFDVFDFISTGRNGDILKRVAFSKTEQDKVYNLALGDVDGDILPFTKDMKINAFLIKRKKP